MHARTQFTHAWICAQARTTHARMPTLTQTHIHSTDAWMPFDGGSGVRGPG